ncbi:AI-2E family transporter [Petropleomorpha daqingensis]|uniref:Putative PurR-regulated permease PerM n=1 Tax=Petropleomorpha daqingensis TaxID=2026353 RepID=A0A853CL47_9ACTN|nr:AI-2E family transporter [Petropleomorpha daqingensis]NYJ08794.1 putative PurR-regulated permease PerM [Petropleomorpha daqingensis]
MVAQPNLPGRRLTPGHEASAASSRPVPSAEPSVEPEEEPASVADVADAAEETAQAEGTPVPDAPLAPSSSGGLPRWLLLLLGGASATVAVAGLREISWLVAPVLLALVVVIALAPVQTWLMRAGWPRWASATVLLVLVWTVLLGFVGLLVLSVAQLAALLPDYADRAEVLINGVVRDLNNAGVVSGQLSDLVNNIDYSQLVGVATGLLSRLTDAATTLLLLLSALVFLAIESGGFGRRLALVAAERPHLPIALGLFARGTRSYLLVSTVFGAIVAIGDAIGLALLGVPAAVLWGVLSFITNYVPNIGFVLGLIPPALLGLLAGGWGELIAIVVLYSVLNFVVQTLIQPRFVGGLGRAVDDGHVRRAAVLGLGHGGARRAARHPADAPGQGPAGGRRPARALAGRPAARGATGAPDLPRAQAGARPAGRAGVGALAAPPAPPSALRLTPRHAARAAETECRTPSVRCR